VDVRIKGDNTFGGIVGGSLGGGPASQIQSLGVSFCRGGAYFVTEGKLVGGAFWSHGVGVWQMILA